MILIRKDLFVHHKLFIKLCLVVFLVCYNANTLVQASIFEIVERSDDQIIILDLNLFRRPIFSGIFAYQDSQGVWIPFSDYIAALDFPIEIQRDDGYAQGWFIRENRQFLLDLKRETVTIDGQKSPITEGVERHAEDIYVRLDLLDKWFPIFHDYRPQQLTIEIESKEKLPIEEAIARNRTWSSLNKPNDSQQLLPVKELPYSWVDWPFTDINLRTTYIHNETSNNTSEIDVSSSAPPSSLTNTDGSFAFTGDFLKTTGQLDFSFNNTINGFERRGNGSIYRQFFGDWQRPLRITAGDMLAPDFNRLSTTTQGAGIQISNLPEQQPTEFGAFTLDGRGPEGWDTELYLNNNLIDVQTVAEDGRYIFNEVPQNFGNNLYRVVLYGPQGQIRERNITRIVDPSWFESGRLLYQLHWQKDDEKFLFNDPQIEPSNIRRGQALFQYGLNQTSLVRSQWLSLNNYNYIANSFQSIALNGITGLTNTTDDQGGMHTNFFWEGRIGDYSASAQWQNFNQFLSPINLVDSLTKQNSLDEESDQFQSNSEGLIEEIELEERQQFSFRINGNLAKSGQSRLSQLLQWRMEKEQSERHNIFHRLSFSGSGKSLSHNLQWASTNKGRVTGSILSRLRHKKLSLSSGLNYLLEDSSSRISQANLAANFYQNRRWSFRGSSQWQFGGIRGTTGRYELNINWNRDSLSWGLSLNRQQDQWQIGIELSTALVHSSNKSGYKSRWQLYRENRTSNSGIAFRAFKDEDVDGIKSSDESWLANVGLTVNQQMIRANENGQGSASNISANQFNHVEVEDRGLDDPFWLPMLEPFSYHSRPGKIIYVDIPIVDSAEIDGTCWIEKDGKKSPLGKVKIQLLNANGELVKETTTTYDGFYLFDKILPGKYMAKVEPEQLKKSNISSQRKEDIEILLTLEPGGDIKSGIDFVIRK